MTEISPSILSADFLRLGEEVAALTQAGADLLHVDVMDGHFVPNLTLGPPIIKAIKRVATIPLDVHLMIKEPELSIDEYIDAGADRLTIHVESVIHLERALKHIKARGVKAGVALNPSTHESAIFYVASIVDVVLIMSVNPGFSGQSFLPSVITKISAVRDMLKHAKNDNAIISVDGGVNEETAASCKKAGANCLVAGAYILGAKDYRVAIASLKN